MFYKNSCYIYLDARAGISHRKDFRVIDAPESFRIARKSFDSVQNTLKVNVLGLSFSNVAGLYLQSLLRNKHRLNTFSKHLF